MLNDARSSILLILGLAAFSLLAWFWLLAPGERGWALRLLARAGKKAK